MADKLGDKVGPRIAQLVHQYVLATRRDLAPIEAKIHQAAGQGLIDRMGHEIGDHYAPFLQAALDFHGDNLDPMLRTFLADTASGRHQWKAAAGILAGGAQGVLGIALSNTLAPIVYQLIEHTPQLALDPATAMAAAAQNIYTFGEGAAAAAKGGFDSSVAQTLYELSQQIPGPDILADLVNRGLIGGADYLHWLGRGGLPNSLVGPVEALRRAILSPADAALAVTRSVLTEAEGAALAAANGVDAHDFAILIANTGEPLGLEQLLEALRRKFIDQARFETGFRQARYRNEWAGTALQLAYAPMSTADAVSAAIQGHLSVGAAKEKATQNGLEPGDFDALYQTAGEPLSRTEMEQLFNRGEVTQAEVDQALVESRLKPKYTGLAFKLHVRLPEGRQVSAMISHGVISKQTGLKWLTQLGYSAEVAAAIVAEGTAVKVGAHKTLTIGEIHSLYVDGVFTVAHTEQLLAGLGFDAVDSAALVKAWDLVAAAAITRQAIGVVRSRYVARRYDHQAASMYLDSLGVAAAARDRYLVLWDIEREATVAVLTPAQIVKAHKETLITGPDAVGRLTAHGYTEGDALILMGAAPGGPVPA